MSLNPYARLRALLPVSNVLLCEVLAVHADDTSTVQLPQATSADFGSGLQAGSTLRVRGAGFAVGQKVFVRDGVIETQAPDATAADVQVGVVVDQPFGPPRLAAAAAVTLAQGAVGAAYSQSAEPAFTGGYNPRIYAAVLGTLPPGLALNPTTGAIAGTPTTAGAFTFTLTCQDSTNRFQAAPPVTLTIT